MRELNEKEAQLQQVAAETPATEKKPEDEATSRPMDYSAHIRTMMKSDKRRGNAKDFVILAHHHIIYDHDRYYEVRAKLPDQLEIGSHVYVHDRDGELSPNRVVRVDENGDVWLFNGNAEHKVTRAECYPTAIPRTPKLVHKSRLERFIGERYATLFWNKALGKRVVRPRKAKVH